MGRGNAAGGCRQWTGALENSVTLAFCASWALAELLARMPLKAISCFGLTNAGSDCLSVGSDRVPQELRKNFNWAAGANEHVVREGGDVAGTRQ